MPLVEPGRMVYAPTYSQLVESVDKLVKRNGALASKIAAARTALDSMRQECYCDDRVCDCAAGKLNDRIDAAIDELNAP